MSDFTILTINPGSSSTKIGVVRGGEVILDKNVISQPGEFDACKTFLDQAPLREQKVLDALAEAGIELSSIDAISGRGVGVQNCIGGTYEINERAVHDAANDVAGIHHPAILGIVISAGLGKKLGVPAYFVNPMNTDELCDEARIVGIRGVYRQPRCHMLNMKQVAIHHCELNGWSYEDKNFIVAHMGGGSSINAHRRGRVIDSTRVGDGQGPLSPNRAGDVCEADIRTLLEAGMTLDEIHNLVTGTGGIMNLLGTDDMMKVTGEMIPAGNKQAVLAYNAMEYSLAKWIATMAGALCGDVDGVLLTGGLANDKELVARLEADCSWIAPVTVYAGSFETEALAAGAERVLAGREAARTYTGEPVFTGFGF